MKLCAVGFQTQAVTDALKRHIPSHFFYSLLVSGNKCIRFTALCSCDCTKSGSFIPSEKLLAGLEGSRTHLFNPVDDVASSAGLPPGGSSLALSSAPLPLSVAQATSCARKRLLLTGRRKLDGWS